MGKYGEPNSNKCCSVPQCKSRCTNEISLFDFPKDEAMRKRWTDATKIEKRLTQFMQVCSRHFVKNDYLLSGVAKVRRLKKTAVPSQNLPWQFPNKRVSPTLAKARMDRLKNRTQQKTSITPTKESKPVTVKKQDPEKADESNESMENGEETKNEKEAFEPEIEHNIENDVQDDKETNENDKSEEAETEELDKVEESIEKMENVAAEAKEKDIDNMPTRGPTRLRQRKGVLKCELCGRKCLTPQALRTHQQTVHKSLKSDEIFPEKSIKAMSKPKEPLKRASMPQISVKLPDTLMPPKPLAKVNKSLNEGDIVARVLQDFDSDDGGSGMDYSSDGILKEELTQQKANTRKTEFECPKCKRKFAVYFSAFRHIQKHHSGLAKDEPVPPNHPIAIKPNRIEICTICNSVLPGDSHICLGPTKLANGLVCSGCGQDFRTLALFDMHKSGRHSEGVESMFFPSLDEFQNWKLRMERQTKVTYSMLDQNDTKQVHRCGGACADSARGRPRLCPSSVIVQEFAKGFQVHYYPDHYDHDFEPYSLGAAFKKYSIASLMNITASRLPDSDEEPGEPDLYLQFKKVTDLLVNEAAKINVSGLKKLMRKALEMMTVVSSYIEDQDDDMTAQLCISPDHDDMHEEVRTALRKFKDGVRKRKSDDVDVPPKKKKLLQSTENTLKINNKGSKANKTSKDSDYLNDSESRKGYVTPNTETVKNDQSPSFINTFQQFVGKIAKPAEKKKGDTKKKNVVKTRMGQFKQSPTKKMSTSPKMESPSRNSIGSVKEIQYEVKEQENDCNILILKI